MKIAGISFIVAVLLLPCALVAPSFANSDSGVVSTLRGGNPLNAMSEPPPSGDLVQGKDKVPRTFAQQPPLIPHGTEGYEITLQRNDCLNCHGVKSSGAPGLPDSHFMDRDGKKRDQVSPARHFCDQCHVQQLDVRPLVTNEFQGAK